MAVVTAFTGPSGGGSGRSALGRSPAHRHQPVVRVAHALQRHLVTHRVLAEHQRHRMLRQSTREVAGCDHGHHRVVGAVLQEHGHVARRVPVDVDEIEQHERAHRQHAGGPHAIAAAQAHRQRHPGSLREATDDRLLARDTVLGARLVEQVVDRRHRVGEALGSARSRRWSSRRTMRTRAAPRGDREGARSRSGPSGSR